MKMATCAECGHVESGSSDKDVLSKMESHLSNEHPDGDVKKLMKEARKTMTEMA